MFQTLAAHASERAEQRAREKGEISLVFSKLSNIFSRFLHDREDVAPSQFPLLVLNKKFSKYTTYKFAKNQFDDNFSSKNHNCKIITAEIQSNLLTIFIRDDCSGCEHKEEKHSIFASGEEKFTATLQVMP